MTVNFFLSLAGALLCSGLAAFVCFKDARSFVHRTFAVGMIALTLEAAITGLSVQTMFPVDVLRMQRLRLVAVASLPGSWLLFSLSYARTNYKEFVARWKWVALAAFVVPLALVTVFGDSFFAGTPALDTSSGWSLRLGWSGYVFHLFFLLSAVCILMNLERTLRASTGSKRWQIKFMVLGLGSLFGVRIYTSSQALLFSSGNAVLEAVNAGALLVAHVLIILSLVRARLLDVDIVLSQAFLHRSLTVLIVGVYLLVVGVLAEAIRYVGGSQVLPLGAFFVFLSLLALAIILLSDQLRQQIKRIISRNLYRSQYDYRKEWTAFTQRTTSLVDIKDLCAAVAMMVSETFGIAAVTLWVLDETHEHLALGGSTVFSEAQAQGLKTAGNGAANLLRSMRDQQMPVDFDRSQADWAGELTRSNPDYFREARIRYCVPLVSGRELLGLMTLSERLTRELFSVEDFDLLKVVADQAAGNLLNLKLSERLLRAKEMEAFQTLSAFFTHDLKNLASTLALTMRNLPAHFDDPAFRADALRVISQSVARINAMCSRLSLLSKKLELQRVAADLNELVTATLASLNSSVKVPLVQDLHPVPGLVMDPEQMQKVLINLVLNANEAVGDRGEIRVATGQRDGWVVMSVNDNGCGMSKEFMMQSLFHPFRTTKKQGLGIGLFHSKVIVEAHQGKIEVESEEGKGSSFRVLLPAR